MEFPNGHPGGVVQVHHQEDQDGEEHKHGGAREHEPGPGYVGVVLGVEVVGGVHKHSQVGHHHEKEEDCHGDKDVIPEGRYGGVKD